METIKVSSQKREQFIDITQEVQSLIKKMDWDKGLICLYCSHTTAGLTINESADPSVPRDILSQLKMLVPKQGDYHHLEGNSDAHIKSSIIGCSQLVIVENGKLVLGTWQGIFFTEFDGPRNRKVFVRWISG